MTAKYSRLLAVALVLLIGACGATPQSTDAPNFQSWLADFRLDALRSGISEQTLSSALDGIKPRPKVIRKDLNQAEFTLSYWHYMDRVNKRRIEKGKELLAKYGPLLKRVQKRYGVQPRFLVAFWGLESNYGSTFGGHPVIPSLATLAYDSRRAKFFRSQLLAALKILDRGDITLDRMQGSWAGAMGHVQFIPTTYESYAVDFDGDGRRDIWHSMADVFASAANYLSSLGWNDKETWGREVRLPPGFDFSQASLRVRKPLGEWQQAGVRRITGKKLPNVDFETSLLVPAGYRGPAFAVYGNFRRIMRWNYSILYAISVGHLADRFIGIGPISVPRPANDRRVSIYMVKEIQARLNQRGFKAGKPDGIVGRGSRGAVRAFQKSKNIPADGHVTVELLELLRGQ
ncbi:lytic murein transglycosylase [Alphaproteobacteria bacterium]|nr:lytic murein transglycosylase [Alphaproteobacteria bacterium]